MKFNSFHRSSRQMARRGQGGFVLGYVLIGLALISAVIAAIVLANKDVATGNQSTSPESNRLMASLIIKKASDARDALARYVVNLGDAGVSADAAGVATLAGAGMGLINPNTAAATDLAKAEAAAGVPVAFAVAATKRAIVVSGISEGVCSAINTINNNTGCASGTYTTDALQ